MFTEDGPCRTYHRGSFTVEASMIMSILLIVIFILIQMTLFLTDTLRMDALVTEDSTYTVNEEVDHDAWRERSFRGFFFLDPSEIQRKASKKEVEVTYQKNGVGIGFHRKEDVRKYVKRDVRDPVTFLRRIRMITDMGD